VTVRRRLAVWCDDSVFSSVLVTTVVVLACCGVRSQQELATPGESLTRFVLVAWRRRLSGVDFPAEGAMFGVAILLHCLGV
jgi:hypothetical protein